MGLLTAGASDGDSKSGFRTCVHSGFWLLKLVLILSLIVAIFVVPISHLVRNIMFSKRNHDKLNCKLMQLLLEKRLYKHFSVRNQKEESS